MKQPFFVFVFLCLRALVPLRSLAPVIAGLTRNPQTHTKKNYYLLL